MKKILKWISLALVTLVLGLFIFIQTSWDKSYDAPYPKITISMDSAGIARGKYLVYGPGHCATCHVPLDQMQEIDKGVEAPLIGGWEISIPPGTFRAPNLTPDKETGIGNMSDEELARSLRHQVAADGGLVFGFMQYQNMSEEDLGAIISYLRSTPAVSHEVAPSELSFLGKALIAFGMIKPEGPKKVPPKSVEKGISIDYGAYIANDVAACKGCHTKRDMSGAFIGEDYAGGEVFPQDDIFKGYGFISPNLTFDSETGLMANWTEEHFIERFRAGRVHKNSPMAWGSYANMDELELKAVYKYLRSIEAVQNLISRSVYEPGEKMPE
ncbi:MAG: cytochrome c [Bacteroidia bacterium]|nr:cytochrome c [Bacteroidia bacterium]